MEGARTTFHNGEHSVGEFDYYKLFSWLAP